MNLRLNDIFLQDWYSNISEMNSCITYKLFKSNLKLEKYLLELNTSERINLCKFRCKNSKILVVVMGYAHLQSRAEIYGRAGAQFKKGHIPK